MPRKRIGDLPGGEDIAQALDATVDHLMENSRLFDPKTKDYQEFIIVWSPEGSARSVPAGRFRDRLSLITEDKVYQ